MNPKKKILLLGATGSIGSQSLDIIEAHPDRFELIGVGAFSNDQKIDEILKRFPEIKAVSLVKEPDKKLKQAWKEKGIAFYSGEEGALKMMEEQAYDMLVNAAVGFAGLAPTLKAIDQNKKIALANKESLVVGGELIEEKLKDSDSVLYPIDSEHSAIFQCLQNQAKPKALYITASGGSLRDLKREELKDVDAEKALAHPNWSMGERITIDSATMVNKAFEIIEACYLFHVEPEFIIPVLHPQSIIHSMVAFEDGSILAQLGPSDMHEPIQFALLEGKRLPLDLKNQSRPFSPIGLELKPMDKKRFPLIDLAYKVLDQKGNTGAVFNGADEEAIRRFLAGEISYLDLENIVKSVFDHVEYIPKPSYKELKESDRLAREYARNWQGDQILTA